MSAFGILARSVVPQYWQNQAFAAAAALHAGQVWPINVPQYGQYRDASSTLELHVEQIIFDFVA